VKEGRFKGRNILAVRLVERLRFEVPGGDGREVIKGKSSISLSLSLSLLSLSLLSLSLLSLSLLSHLRR
jgi:hypothetical protein